MRFAILIDAGFAKTKLGNRDQPATAEDFTDLVARICEHAFLADNTYIGSIIMTLHLMLNRIICPSTGANITFPKTR